jgi:hypothetical protein
MIYFDQFENIATQYCLLITECFFGPIDDRKTESARERERKKKTIIFAYINNRSKLR